MRDVFQQIGRVAVTLIGLALFGFCFFQLVFVARVMTQGDGELVMEEQASEDESEAEVIDTRPVILVDAGHGGVDGGAVGGGVIEKHEALAPVSRPPETFPVGPTIQYCI